MNELWSAITSELENYDHRIAKLVVENKGLHRQLEQNNVVVSGAQTSKEGSLVLKEGQTPLSLLSSNVNNDRDLR